MVAVVPANNTRVFVLINSTFAAFRRRHQIFAQQDYSLGRVALSMAMCSMRSMCRTCTCHVNGEAFISTYAEYRELAGAVAKLQRASRRALESIERGDDLTNVTSLALEDLGLGGLGVGEIGEVGSGLADAAADELQRNADELDRLISVLTNGTAAQGLADSLSVSQVEELVTLVTSQTRHRITPASPRPLRRWRGCCGKWHRRPRCWRASRRRACRWRGCRRCWRSCSCS